MPRIAGSLTTQNEENRRLPKAGFLLLVVLPFFAVSLLAQSSEISSQRPEGNSGASVVDYKIGADDVLLVSVMDAPEFGGKFRVSDAGTMEIPGVSASIRAEGLSSTELAQAIRNALIDAKQLRDPRVSVFVDEYHGRTITVLGAVTKPDVYSLRKKTMVLDALSIAGGTLPNSGTTVTIMRGAASAEATGTAVGSIQIINMARLLGGGGDATANVEVRNGDVISVSAAEVVYVVGAVIKPGGFTMSNPSEGISVVQAVALAEGVRPIAASHRALIIRQSTSEHARQEIPVDVAQMLTGKSTDMLLAPNDILYIPESGKKKTLKTLGDMAVVAATGIAVYGIGYRIANNP